MAGQKSKRVLLNVRGMHCASCAQTIEKALKEHPGVKEASVNLASEKASVTYDPSVTRKSGLIEAVRAVGYDAAPETKKAVVKIGGMTCASCAQTIENALRKTEGVVEASVNLASERAVVVYDVEEIDYEGVKAVIEGAGYRVLGREEGAARYEREIEEERRRFHEARTRMTIAWAFTVLIIAWMVPEMTLGAAWPSRTVYDIGMTLLAVPPLFWAGRETFLSAVRAASHGSANMDVLIALGTSAAFVTGPAALFGPVMNYAGVAGMIMSFHLTGRYIEARAKGRASQAIRKLLELEGRGRCPSTRSRSAT